MNNKQGGGSTILIIIVVILILAGLGSCVGDSDSDSDDSRRCSSCGKTFTNSADTSSIAWTSMCEPCYEDFKFMQDLQEELKKYDERYGN